MGWRHDRLCMRVRGHDQRCIRRLIWTWRRLHLWVRIPVRILLGRVCRRKMTVEMRRMVSHVCRRRTHIGRPVRVGNLMLPSWRRHGRLPMGHCGQMMVHHVQALGAVALTVQPRVTSMGAMREMVINMLDKRPCTGLFSHSECKVRRGEAGDGRRW